MHPHTAISLALIAELGRERTRIVRPPSPKHRGFGLRAVRSRRAPRLAPAGCA